MNKPKINFDAFVNYILKIIAPMIVLIGICGNAYYELYLEPKIEERLKPLTIFVLENNLLLRKTSPDSIKKEVQDELQAYTKYFDCTYPELP